MLTSNNRLLFCDSTKRGEVHPVLWGDWSRTQPRRDWIGWQRSHLVTLKVAAIPRCTSSPPSTFSRAERAHWRMTQQQRLARNRRPPSAPPIEISCCTLLATFLLDLNALVERALLPIFFLLFLMGLLFVWSGCSSLLFSLLLLSLLFFLTRGQKGMMLISLVVCLFLVAYPVGSTLVCERSRITARSVACAIPWPVCS